MTIEDKLIDRLAKEAQERGVLDYRLTHATARLDALNRIENQRDEFKAEVEKRRAEQRAAEPKLRELYRAAEVYLTEAERRPPVRSREDACAALRKALHEAFNYCDQIPF